MKQTRYFAIAGIIAIAILFGACSASNAAIAPMATNAPSSAMRSENKALADEEMANAPSGEKYAGLPENPFYDPSRSPYSTFSIDVDTAAYSNMRRFLNAGQMPPADSVRVEEFVNYFPYDYAIPRDDKPFAVRADLATCPWNAEHKLLRVAIKGRELDLAQAPSSNLVFLIDVSGSMGEENKLPLLKKSFSLLVDKLRASDRISIAVYAGAAGVVLPPTPGDKKDLIMGALNKLQSGGSTAGGEGLALAYKLAGEGFIEGGNNRIIIATDGDFNVGPNSVSDMEKIVVAGAEKGIFISVLGFGMGNYRDDMAEVIADKGRGNYAYIDGLPEARKVFGRDLVGTLFAIAKDVKIQIQFNPELVGAYRLIGYENRVMATEDFNDDKKAAGTLGAGHTVTAFFEIVPPGGKVEVDAKKAIEQAEEPATAGSPCVVRLRYKEPEGEQSLLILFAASPSSPAFESLDAEYRFAASVAAFAMILRDSPNRGSADFAMVRRIAGAALGPDPYGYRAEFIGLVDKAASIAKK